VGESLVAGFAGTEKELRRKNMAESGVLGLWKVPPLCKNA